MGQILRTALSTHMHRVSDSPATAKNACLSISSYRTGTGFSMRRLVSGLRTCPVVLHHAVHTGSVRDVSRRRVAQVSGAAVSGLAVEAVKAAVMGQLLVESRHAPVRWAFLHASVAGGGEPVFREKTDRLFKFRLF